MVTNRLTFIFFAFILIIVAVTHANKKETLDLSRVKACFNEQKEKCGDLICEMSTDDLYLVVEQIESNILDCLEN